MPVMLNLDHPALIFGDAGRLGMPSSSVELGDPKFGGKTLAPSLVYATRRSRIEAGVRLSELPSTAFWPRVAVVPNPSLNEPSSYPLNIAGRNVVRSEKLYRPNKRHLVFT